MPLDIEGILFQAGIVVTHDDGTEFWARCPLHSERTGKEDLHPSWSMNANTFAHHCFSCGYSGNLVTLYRDLTGAVPDNLEWEVAKQSVVSTLERQPEVEVEGPHVSEWSLKQYGEIPEILLRRKHLRREALDRFGVRWDRDTKCWVIPIRTPEGDLMGYQYRQRGSVINYPEGMKKSETLFGVHLVLSEHRMTVVESPLDAVRLWGVGVPAVASFGASVSTQQIDLLARNYRFVIVAMDNDPPGRRSSQHLAIELRKRGCVPMDFNYSGLAVKDPGDVESDETLRKAWISSNSLNIVQGD